MATVRVANDTSASRTIAPLNLCMCCSTPLLLYDAQWLLMISQLHSQWHAETLMTLFIFTTKTQLPCVLTHISLVRHMCVNGLGQHCFRYWLVAYSAPSHYQNQGWVFVNWTLRNKTFHSRKCIWKYRQRNHGNFVQGEMIISVSSFLNLSERRGHIC